jgi:16S rRNA processing protein RimM
MMHEAPELIIIGRVRKAHGLRGELVVEPITDEPDAVFAPGRCVLAGNTAGEAVQPARELHIAAASPFKGGFIVRFDEVSDRNEAELWRDRYLLLAAEELAGLGEGEVYLHELPGMRVLLQGNEEIGKIVAFYDLPQGLTLELSRAGGKPTVLIPYDRVVTDVDREERVIRIDPPAGLLD